MLAEDSSEADMKMKIQTEVVVSQPSGLAYNQAPSTPLSEIFPQACISENQDDLAALFSVQTEKLQQAVFTFGERMKTNLTDLMQGLQDSVMCASSSPNHSSWQTQPVPDPVYIRILATIERYAAAHPGPDPALYSHGSNPPQYICSDEPHVMRNQLSLCRPTFNEFQHVESDTRCSDDFLNRTVCQKVKHPSTRSHYTRPPVTGEAWQVYHDMLENAASLEGWTQMEIIRLLPPPRSIRYPGVEDIVNHPVVITTQPSQSSIILSETFPKDQLVAPPLTQQVAHSEVLKELIVDEETVALDIHTLHTEKCVITVTSSNLHAIKGIKPHICTTVSIVESVPTTGMTILSSDVEIKPPEVAKLDTSIACVSKYKHFQSEELHVEGTVMGIVQLLLMLLGLLRNSSNYCATYSFKNQNVDSDRVEGHPDTCNLAASEKPRFHVNNKWWVSTYGWDSYCFQELTLDFCSKTVLLLANLCLVLVVLPQLS